VKIDKITQKSSFGKLNDNNNFSKRGASILKLFLGFGKVKAVLVVLELLFSIIIV